ncbi:MAG TPA: Flp family type IVb pilin [Candidatus Polarisedimenticolia bacterium]|jgi:Flp pilus assembly pilin Flp|nr:Flp family type IVb pilin [Candidatus Polarisedimenticolia bacterium]
MSGPRIAEPSRRFWRELVRSLLRDRRAQDLAEYGMLAALIAVVAIVAIAAVGSTLTALWSTITSAFGALP